MNEREKTRSFAKEEAEIETRPLYNHDQTPNSDFGKRYPVPKAAFPMDLPDFEIFTSMRADMILAASELNAELSTMGQPSRFYMLRHHRDRMLAAAHAFGWGEAIAALDGPAGLLLLERKLFEHLELKYGDFNCGNPLKVGAPSILSPPISTHLNRVFFANPPPGGGGAPSACALPPAPQNKKVRILLSAPGRLAAISTPTPEVELATLFPAALPPRADSPAWRIFVSPRPTRATPHTSHKTTARKPYDAARALLPPSSAADLPAEILLVDADGAVTEGSITTPYFWRAGTWVTPAASRGGNIGTTRRWALERGLCVEGQVKRGDLEMGEGVWLSNGVRGWGWGRIEDLAGKGQEESG